MQACKLTCQTEMLNMSTVLQPVEKLAKGLVSVILALSLVAARADFLWLGNSDLLSFSAGQKHRKQTVLLRRILLLEVSFWRAITLAPYSFSCSTFTLHCCVCDAAEPPACCMLELHHAPFNSHSHSHSHSLSTTCMFCTPL